MVTKDQVLKVLSQVQDPDLHTDIVSLKFDTFTNAGFKIINPKAKGTCGCGESVSFDL